MEKDRLLLSALRAVASTVNRRDPYTSGHSERVAAYCDRVATSLQLSDDHSYFLSLSAWLHDLGILSTPRYNNELHPTRPFFYFFAGPSR
jgi:HD-GYP domain-containing protein (c-di-GMP phosphodiesterase class II)